MRPDTDISVTGGAGAGARRLHSVRPALLAARLLAIGSLAVAAGGGAGAQAAAPDPEPVAIPPVSPAASEFFDSDGIRLRFIDEGAGEPVVLVHGFSLNLEINWVQPGIAAALADAGYRVIAYDFRGHGASEKPHESTAYGPAEVEDPIRLLDHLGIERAHVVGYSRGAMIALRVRQQHPERLLSVVLGGYTETEAGPPFPEEAVEELATAMAGGDYRPLVHAVAPDLAADEVERWNGLLAGINDGRALAACFRSGAAFQPLSAVEPGENATPTLAIVGERDAFRDGVSRMAALIRGLETVVIPDADHATAIGRPELVTAVLGFLDKHGANDRDGLEELVREYEATWQSHDGGELAVFFAEDADMILGIEPRIVGREAIAAWWDLYFSRLDRGRRLSIAVESIRILGPDVALLEVATTTAGTHSTTNEVLEPRRARGTWVVTRRDGGWRIAALRAHSPVGELREAPGRDE